MIGEIKARLYNRLRLVSGTVARPETPNGKRALFYCDKKGNHWPLKDLLKMKLGLKPGPRIGFLGTPQYFREMMGLDSRVNHLSPEIRQMLFEGHKITTWDRLFINKARDFIWDENGLTAFSLKVETKTGTLFMGPDLRVDAREAA
jgi:hypothetical protein